MRKLITMSVVAFVLAFACAGCSGSGQVSASSSSEEQYADQQFITDLARALEARWAITDIQDDAEDERTRRTKAVDAELDILSDYSSAKFEDSALQEKVVGYINALKAQKDSLDYYAVDSEKYNDDWEKAYDTRTQLLKSFVNDYGLEVSDKHANTLKDLITNATLVDEQNAQQAAVDALCAAMVFAPGGDEFGHEYVAVVENTSGIAFDSFVININLLDADGVVIDSIGDSVNNWEPGQKAKFDFYSPDDFASVSVKPSYWQAQD